MAFYTETKTSEVIDPNGDVIFQNKTEFSKKIENDNEPDYIKLYTRVWCEFNQVPLSCRELFLELAIRMSYANTNALESSQVVSTGGPIAQAICKKLDWKPRMYYTGLKKLQECGAIKKISRGFYQINPEYAGKGPWRYDAKRQQGGVKDLVATFHFKDKKVDTKIVWAENDTTDEEYNKMHRKGLKVKKGEDAMLKYTTVKDTEAIEALEGLKNDKIGGNDENHTNTKTAVS